MDFSSEVASSSFKDRVRITNASSLSSLRSKTTHAWVSLSLNPRLTQNAMRFAGDKSPSFAPAIGNGITQTFNAAMPSFGHSGSDETSNNKLEELAYDTDSLRISNSTESNIASNLTSSGDIDITSEDNNLISGSNLDATNINLTSTSGTTIITSVADTSSTSTSSTAQDYADASFDYNRGRVSANSNSTVTEETSSTNTTTQKQSELTATNNITILSKDDLSILSSNLTTDSGAISLTSEEGNVNILALANTTSTTSETKSGTQTLSAGIGNAHIDTAYATDDLVKAGENLKDAKTDLNHMETLYKNGQADKEAVEDAKTNLTIAYLNFVLAETKLAAAATKSAASAESLYTGFYTDLRLSIEGTKTNSNSNTSTAVASNILSNGNLIISSGMSSLTGDTTITGANISSTLGDIEITSRGDTIINASKDTYNSSTSTKSWSENLTLATTNGGGAGAMIDNAVNALQTSLGLAMSKSKSDTSSTTYNNSILTAEAGTIKINSLNDATFSGANLLAENIELNTVGDLTIESLQNSYQDKGSSFGMNLGSGGSGSSGVSNGSFGLNYSSNKTDRLWTDNQTSILGTSSVTVNTGDNTNLKGAILANITNANSDSVILSLSKDAIDGGNLTLNTNSLTFSNLYDHEYSQTSGAGMSTNIGKGVTNNISGQGTALASNPNQQTNFYPSGSTTLSAQNSGYKKEQTTFATIGEGDVTTNSILTFDSNGDLISNTGGTLLTSTDSTLTSLNRDITNSQVITKDTITNALSISTTIDNRIIAGLAGNETALGSLSGEQRDLGGNLAITTKAQAQLLDAPLVALATSDITGLSYAASYVAGEGGSFATLATQLFGLNYLLDSGNTRFQNNTISNIDNATLTKAIQGKDGFSLQQKIGYETEDGQKVNFFTITDKDGNSQTFRYVSSFTNLDDIKANDIINAKDYSLHGIDNTSDEAVLKGIMQLGTITNRTTSAENDSSKSTFTTLNAPTKGTLNDGFENLYNAILGKTPIASANIIQLQDFSQNLASTAKENNLTDIRMVGHSNGGDRLYLGILRGAAENKAFKDLRIQVQFYGTPSLTNNIQEAAAQAGLGDKYSKTIQHIINQSDPVPNLLGRNAGLNPITIRNSLLAVPTLGSTTLSPHSNYYCQGSFCNFDKVNNSTSSQ